MSDRPVLSGTLRGYAEAWRKLRAEGHPGGVQPEDLMQWADQVAVLEQEIARLRDDRDIDKRWRKDSEALTAERRAHQEDVERLTQERDEIRGWNLKGTAALLVCQQGIDQIVEEMQREAPKPPRHSQWPEWNGYGKIRTWADQLSTLKGRDG